MVEINTIRLRELVDEYSSVRDRTRQREIENEILEETVWKTTDDVFHVPESQMRLLLSRIDDDDEVADEILTRHMVEKL